ncbi:MAG: phospholipase D family protein [Myxococcales bacterium]|nr:phospholipase D family protein [Myxococcales bacterium]
MASRRPAAKVAARRPAVAAPTSGPLRSVRVRMLADAEHYTHLVTELVAKAEHSLWIATANVKEMRVEAPVGTRARARGSYVSMLDTLAGLVRRGVELRFLHGAPPSRPFRAELARQSTLLRRKSDWMRMCPRVHLKLVAIDGRHLYLGSANFTGAGLGAKGDGRRNFEMGIVTDDDVLLDRAQARFDAIWSGRECKGCRLRGVCPRPIDTLGRQGK